MICLLASGQGGGHDIFSTSFNFQCATPRGLIRWVTVGCNYPLLGHFGLSFKLSIYYTKGAHSLGHRWLQLPTFWAFWIKFQIFNVLPQGGSFDYPPLAAITHFWGILDSVSNFQCATPRGLIRWVTVGCNYSLFGHSGFSFKCLMCYPKGLIRWVIIGGNYSLLGHFGFNSKCLKC